MCKLDKEIISEVTLELMEVQQSLSSLGALFEGGSQHTALNGDEFSGIGQILKIYLEKLEGLKRSCLVFRKFKESRVRSG